jgi:hypothetical protein
VLEAFSADVTFAPSIIVTDGSICASCVRVTEAYTRDNPVRMVVARCRRHDFRESDPSLIPAHQNGAWTTSVFLKEASAHVD